MLWGFDVPVIIPVFWAIGHLVLFLAWVFLVVVGGRAS